MHVGRTVELTHIRLRPRPKLRKLFSTPDLYRGWRGDHDIDRLPKWRLAGVLDEEEESVCATSNLELSNVAVSEFHLVSVLTETLTETNNDTRLWLVLCRQRERQCEDGQENRHKVRDITEAESTPKLQAARTVQPI
jgi:hypothetical protein